MLMMDLPVDMRQQNMRKQRFKLRLSQQGLSKHHRKTVHLHSAIKQSMQGSASISSHVMT